MPKNNFTLSTRQSAIFKHAVTKKSPPMDTHWFKTYSQNNHPAEDHAVLQGFKYSSQQRTGYHTVKQHIYNTVKQYLYSQTPYFGLAFLQRVCVFVCVCVCVCVFKERMKNSHYPLLPLFNFADLTSQSSRLACARWHVTCVSLKALLYIQCQYAIISLCVCVCVCYIQSKVLF